MKVVRISGSAGTGKTTILNMLEEKFRSEGRDFIFLSSNSTITGVRQLLEHKKADYLLIDGCNNHLLDELSACIDDTVTCYVTMQQNPFSGDEILKKIDDIKTVSVGVEDILLVKSTEITLSVTLGKYLADLLNHKKIKYKALVILHSDNDLSSINDDQLARIGYSHAHRLAEIQRGNDRYEKLRKLNVQQFSELWKRNIAGEGFFDEMLDALWTDTKPDNDARCHFETWAKNQVYFGYDIDRITPIFERDGEGYTDACVHAAWIGWKARVM